MRKAKKGDFASQIDERAAPACSVAGCGAPGTYKAPRSRADLDHYDWYCLEHVRAFNQRWDYFDGMNRDQIEEFMRDAVTGHRPTWEREQVRPTVAMLRDALGRFMHHAPTPRPALATLPANVRKAIHTLGLDYPCTPREAKAHYRTLVKTHHPDKNPNDPTAEERFKRIASAYHTLEAYFEHPAG